MANTMTQAQMQAQAMADEAAMQKEMAARPRTGVAGPEMPTFGDQSISPVEKAKQAKDLAAKIKANTPSPIPPQQNTPRLPVKPSVPQATPTNTPRLPVKPSVPQATPTLTIDKSYYGKPTSPSLNTRSAVVQSTSSGPVDSRGGYDDSKYVSPSMGAGAGFGSLSTGPQFNPALLTGTPKQTAPLGAGAGTPMRKGGKVKASSYKSGGNVSKASSASRRGDGIAQRGKTKGRMI
jgi:hypothetical protein